MKDKKFKYKYQGIGLKTKERNVAEKKFDEYRQHYPHLKKYSDLQLLEELIYREMLSDEIKKSKNKDQKKFERITNSVMASKQLQEDLDKSLDAVLKLKTKLGLFEDKKVLDTFKDHQESVEQFAEYRRTHPDEFKTTCPFCGKFYYLKRRTKNYEEVKDVWFYNKTLCNIELYKLYEKKKITKKEYAQCLGTSTDYISWLKEHLFDRINKK